MKHIDNFESFLNEEKIVEGKTYSNSQIDKAVENASGEFWGSIASSFPEIKSGDFSPADTIKFENAMKDAVSSWLKQNS